jgi:hypothetical protein
MPRERGQVLAIFALALVAIVAMTGLVLDGGSTFVQRRDMQNVADAAAMAGAYDYVNNNDATSAIAAAKAAAVANGYAEGVDGVVVNVTVTDGWGGGKLVNVSVGKPHRNSFSGIVGMPTWDVSTTASAITGPPNAAVGAAPIIFNKKAFPGNNPNTQDQAYDEPGTGTEDVPQTASTFNWTVYCTANGNPCNANSNQVKDLIDGTNQNESLIDTTTDIGPLNAGAHADLFSALAALVGGPPFPVAVVDDEGEFEGIAMFQLTGSVGGSTKQIRGYFVTPYSGAKLRIVPGVAAGSSIYGGYVVQLVK